MFRCLRVGAFGLVLAFGGAAALLASVSRSALAQPQRPQNLQLHKWKFRIDENGRLFLSVQFANMGGRSVRITGIAPARRGPWTLVNQNLAPEATIRWSIPVQKDPPNVLWVDCSDRLLHFDLPTRH